MSEGKKWSLFILSVTFLMMISLVVALELAKKGMIMAPVWAIWFWLFVFPALFSFYYELKRAESEFGDCLGFEIFGILEWFLRLY